MTTESPVGSGVGGGVTLSPRPLLILDEADLESAVRSLLRQEFVVIDVETDSLDFLTNDVMWVGLSSIGERYLIPLSHPNGHLITPERVVEEPDMSTVRPYKRDPTKFTKPKMKKVLYPATFTDPPEQIRPDRAFRIMEPLFFSHLTKVGHNLKFDLKSIAKYYGEDDSAIPSGPYADTLLLMHVLDENKSSYGLKTLTADWLLGLAAQNPNVRAKFYPEVGKRISSSSVDDVATYLERDITYTQWLYRYFSKGLTGSLHQVFQFEMRLYEHIMKMEYNGIRVDPEEIGHLSKILGEEIASLEEQIFDITGPFELSNVDKKKEFLFSPKPEGQGLKPKATTKTGKPQLRKEDLKEFARDNELAALFLDWNVRNKLKSTFVDPYVEEFIHPKTGRTHASFKQHGAATGRLSSAEPNLQQVPARSALGSAFRKCIVPEKGGKLIVADYDQVELRGIAHISGDPEMMRLFRSEEDIHRTAAAAMYGIDPDEVTDDQRAAGKTFNFAIGYGAGAAKLSSTLGIPVKEGEKFIQRYYERFAYILPWKEQVITSAVARGDRRDPVNFPPYVEIPPFGRRRRLPNLFSDDDYEVFRAQRQAVNAVIQGFCSYIIKIATIRLAEALGGSSARIVAQVHDEMVVEVLDPREVDEVYALVISAMEDITVQGKPVLGEVPLVASGGIGDSWVEAKS